MPAWKGKSKGTPLGYRIFVGVLKTVGVPPAYFLLRFVAAYYLVFSWQTSKSVFDYFHRRLGFNQLKSLWMLYRNYFLLGQSLIDKVVVMSGMPNRFTFQFDGEDHLRTMVKENGGGLLLSAHIGNWEIAGHLLSRLETTINIVVFDAEHQHIKQYLASVMGKKKVNVIVIKDDLSHIYAIMEAFKNNELVCMHADRFIEGNKTLYAHFLGARAKFPMGPFVLAAQFNVPVSFVFAMKESKRHYHFFATKPQISAHPKKADQLQQLLDGFVVEMESKVRQYPAQWFNYYNFWQS